MLTVNELSPEYGQYRSKYNIPAVNSIHFWGLDKLKSGISCLIFHRYISKYIRKRQKSEINLVRPISKFSLSAIHMIVASLLFLKHSGNVSKTKKVVESMMTSKIWKVRRAWHQFTASLYKRGHRPSSLFTGTALIRLNIWHGLSHSTSSCHHCRRRR